MSASWGSSWSTIWSSSSASSWGPNGPAWALSWSSNYGVSWGDTPSAASGIVGCFYQANFAQTNFIQPCPATASPPRTGDPGGLAHAHYWARRLRNRRLMAEAAQVASVAAKPIVLPAVAPVSAPINRLAIELDALVEALRKDHEAAQRRQVQIDELKRLAQVTAQLYKQQRQLDRDNDAAAFVLLLD